MRELFRFVVRCAPCARARAHVRRRRSSIRLTDFPVYVHRTSIAYLPLPDYTQRNAHTYSIDIIRKCNTQRAYTAHTEFQTQKPGHIACAFVVAPKTHIRTYYKLGALIQNGCVIEKLNFCEALKKPPSPKHRHTHKYLVNTHTHISGSSGFGAFSMPETSLYIDKFSIYAAQLLGTSNCLWACACVKYIFIYRTVAE